MHRLTTILTLITVLASPSSIHAQDNNETGLGRSWIFYPVFGFQPETRFQFGAVALGVFNSSDSTQSEYQRRSSFTPFVIYTTRNQFLSAFNIDYFLKSGKNLNVTPRFYNFPDRFFGIGNSNDPELFENYTNQYVQLEGQLSIPKSNNFFYGIAFDIHSTSIRKKEAGQILEQNIITGSNGGFLFGLGPAIRYDTRNNAIYPSTGYFLNGSTIFTYLGDFEYTQITTDLRKYISLKDDRDVLAIQLAGFFLSGNQVPFYKLPQLGGDNRLRGITNASLYRDQQTIFSQFEYRRHVYWAFGLVAFVGAGDVAKDFSSFDLSEFKYVGGLGLRYQVIPGERLNIRFDYGLAKGGQSAFYIGLREAF